LAVADMARTYVPTAEVALKWPNDVMVEGRKAAGILVESGSRPGGLWLAVGIGVNLATPPEVAERPATCLADHGAQPPPSPRAALETLAEAFERWSRMWDAEGFPAIAQAWTARAYGLG